MVGDALKTEKDLRRIISVVGGEKVFWVEPNAGGTFGLFDCFIAAGPEDHFWLELKCDVFNKDNGHWIVNMRLSQMRVLKRFSNLEVNSYVLVLHPDPQINLAALYSGEAILRAKTRDKEAVSFRIEEPIRLAREIVQST